MDPRPELKEYVKTFLFPKATETTSAKISRNKEMVERGKEMEMFFWEVKSVRDINALSWRRGGLSAFQGSGLTSNFFNFLSFFLNL